MQQGAQMAFDMRFADAHGGAPRIAMRTAPADVNSKGGQRYGGSQPEYLGVTEQLESGPRRLVAGRRVGEQRTERLILERLEWDVRLERIIGRLGLFQWSHGVVRLPGHVAIGDAGIVRLFGRDVRVGSGQPVRKERLIELGVVG
jgi:hypothetical protein